MRKVGQGHPVVEEHAIGRRQTMRARCLGCNNFFYIKRTQRIARNDTRNLCFFGAVNDENAV